MTIYSAVLLMLLGGVSVVVEGGMRYLRLAEVSETVNQQAMVGLRKILFELAPASQGALEVDSAPQQHVTFLSPERLERTPPGYTFVGASMEWKKWVSVFRDGEQVVLVEDELATPVVDPMTAPIPDFAATVLTWTPRKPLASNVSDLSFTRNGAVIQIEIVTSASTGTGKSTDLQLISSVRLLNE